MDEEALQGVLERQQRLMIRLGTEAMAGRLLLQQLIAGAIASRKDPQASLEVFREAALRSVSELEMGDDDAVALEMRAGARAVVIRWLQEVRDALPPGH